MVYDCTDADTFDKMHTWVQELKNYMPHDIPIVIAGNKADMHKNKVIDEEKAQKYAQANGMLHFATSAMTGQNIEQLFT